MEITDKERLTLTRKENESVRYAIIERLISERSVGCYGDYRPIEELIEEARKLIDFII